MPLSSTTIRHCSSAAEPPGLRCSRPWTNSPSHLDHRRLLDAVELQPVGDQVLQQLPHLQRIGLDGGQMADLDPPAGLLDLHLQIGDDLAGDLGQIDGHEALPLRGDAREREQPVDQRLHPLGGALHPLEAVAAGVVELVAALHLQAIAEGANLPQRLLEIVRGDVGELLQLAVRPLQLGRVARLLLLGLLAAADVADEERQHGRALLAG